MSKTLEHALQHDRKIIMLGLVTVCAVCWGWLLLGAGMGMDGIEMTRHSLMGMNMLPQEQWSLSYATLMFSMWLIMMIAMMIPSASPVILLAAALNRRSNASTPPYGSSIAFTSGYLLIWALFSVVAVAVQWLLQHLGLINGLIQSRYSFVSGVILIVAGVWQFTPWKFACLRHCRGAIDYLTRFRREGNTGALIMGMQHGLYCLGCCWFLMALLFVGGAMNLVWVAGISIYVWVEKVLPGGDIVARVMGALLVAWGASFLIV